MDEESTVDDNARDDASGTTVPPGLAGQRLDHALAALLCLSHGEARRLLDAGVVQYRGRVVGLRAKGRRVEAGDALKVAPATDRIIAAAETPLREIASGDGWLVIDKPAGMPVHPLRPGETGTVLNAVVARHPQVQNVGEGGLRSGVVHRLDVETSGTLAIATAEPTWRRLRAAFASHAIRKTYLAIVAGRCEGAGEASLSLAVARHRPARVEVVPAERAGARRCTLAWRNRAVNDHASVLQIDLGTGFLHQIRAMMAARGHPLLGDATYGGPTAVAGVAAVRPMLHARALAYEEIQARCEPPADMRLLAGALGLSLPE